MFFPRSSNPVSNYTIDAAGCAPTYFTVGDGGNSEGVRFATLRIVHPTICCKAPGDSCSL